MFLWLGKKGFVQIDCLAVSVSHKEGLWVLLQRVDWKTAEFFLPCFLWSEENFHNRHWVRQFGILKYTYNFWHTTKNPKYFFQRTGDVISKRFPVGHALFLSNCQENNGILSCPGKITQWTIILKDLLFSRRLEAPAQPSVFGTMGHKTKRKITDLNQAAWHFNNCFVLWRSSLQLELKVLQVT